MTRLVPLAEAADAALVGGKAATLARLARAGFPVPPGFCVGTDALAPYAAAVAPAVTAALGDPPPRDPAGARRAAAAIRTAALATPLPAPLARALAGARAALAEPRPGAALAVRSSSPAEDGAHASYAGQHETVLGVRGDAALDAAVRTVWASLWAAPAILYRGRRGTAAPPAMAVLVQTEVACEAAGVLFTRDPREPSAMRLEAVRGAGERLVGGRGADESWGVAREGGGAVRTGAGPALLAPADVARLAALGRALEAFLGGPQDVEWGLAAGALVVLQARPITTSGAPRAATG
ncbi:MAG TPA: PEP/pyruvate-binding domain-containing protein [Candidatus Binatia bacterium]|nr:PEP/pyruvate-binding domain-containing protein [Candidatus Binatia bacterium]